MLINTPVEGRLIYFVLYKNGVAWKRFSVTLVGASVSELAPTGSVIAYANGTTDYFEVYIYHSFDNLPDITPGQAYSFFQGEYIGN